MKIRCQRCHKRISIDEAFAGGLCRCPYCKAIAVVPVGRSDAAGERRQERPEVPAAPVGAEAAQAPRAEPAEAVPLAGPVRVQGIVALVLSGFLVLLVALGVVLAVQMWSGREPVGRGNGAGVPGNNARAPGPGSDSRYTDKGPRVARMAITPPVVYVLDASSGMRDLFDPALAVARYSIRTLTDQDKFNVILLCEEDAEALAEAWVAGGDAGDLRLKDFTMAIEPAGATDLDAGLRQALALAPKTVVVLSAKAVRDAKGMIGQARKGGVKVFAVVLDGHADVAEVMENLADQTGGRYRQFTASDIMEWLADAPPLP